MRRGVGGMGCPTYLCPAVMVTFSWGGGMDATLEAVNILVSDSWRERERARDTETKRARVEQTD